MQNVAGVALFLFWRKKILLILRDDKPDISCPNVWCVPTGGLEPGEIHQEGAERECLEELGICPKLLLWGISPKGNGIFFAELCDEEKDAIVLGEEGQMFEFFSDLDLWALNRAGLLGGITKVYYEADHEVLSTLESPWDKVSA